MDWSMLAIISTIFGSLVLVAVFGYLWWFEREHHLLLWLYAWGFYTARLAIDFADELLDTATLLRVGSETCAVVAGLLLLWGTFEFLEIRFSRWWIVAAVVSVAWTAGFTVAGLTMVVASAPTYVFLGVANIVTGVAWFRKRCAVGFPGRVAGVVFVIWGFHKFDFPLLRPMPSVAPYGFLFGSVLSLFVALAVLIAHFEMVRSRLMESEERYRAIFTGSASILLLIEPFSGRIVDVNDAAVRYYGWSREQLLEMSIQDLNTRPDSEVRALMEDARSGEQGYFRFRHRHEDGDESEVEVYSGPVIVDGEQRLLSIVHDVSRRVAAEYAVVTQQQELETRVAARTAALEEALMELEQATKLKDRFLANMSHELRTPLNSILGFSGTLLQGLAGQVNEEQKRQIEMIQASGKRLLAMVNDILDLERIDAGRAELHLASQDVGDLVTALALSFEPLCRQKGIDLRVESPSEPVIVSTDRRYVEQIVINLLANAVKFTTEGHVEISVQRLGETIHIAVTDTGIGIASERLRSIFDEFVQVDSSEEAKPQGTGLGLAISRRLADLLSGHIEVKSALGEGSTFTLLLPAG